MLNFLPFLNQQTNQSQILTLLGHRRGATPAGTQCEATTPANQIAFALESLGFPAKTINEVILFLCFYCSRISITQQLKCRLTIS